MSTIYFLPDNQNEKKQFRAESNSIIIIGANGSGKSKLGAWIEQCDPDSVHRIGGQRKLSFKENIDLLNYKAASSRVMYGSEHNKHKVNRWGNEYTTRMLEDFEYTLSALLALKNNENDIFINKFKKTEIKDREQLSSPITVVDRLMAIWEDVFPHRKLKILDSKFFALFYDEEGKEHQYSAREMSDGERAALYLITQVLSITENKTFIIDEPELHLHGSIMSRLWQKLEEARPDCLFIYITHDTNFAAQHNNAEKIWVKSFDGTVWEWEKLTENAIPEGLLLEILGSRKPILFVEGNNNSLDMQLYSALYPNFHIIACGSCMQVIERTRTFQNTKELHGRDVYGIIDRDYRTNNEIEAYKRNNIYTLDVAEVENLFLVEELIKIIINHENMDANEIFEKIKSYIIKERFEKQIDSQICKSIVADIKYRLQLADISKENEEKAKSSLNQTIESLNYESIKSEHEQKFQAALENQDYVTILKIFNEKKLATSIGHFFGKDNKDYCPLVLRMLHSGKYPEILEALNKYLPPEISLVR